MNPHATPDTLAHYVTDRLAPAAAARLEQHVRVCARCAGALATEARLEVALGALLPRRREAAAIRRGPSLAAAVAGLALVIGVSLGTGWRSSAALWSSHTTEIEEPPVVAELLACRAEVACSSICAGPPVPICRAR